MVVLGEAVFWHPIVGGASFTTHSIVVGKLLLLLLWMVAVIGMVQRLIGHFDFMTR